MHRSSLKQGCDGVAAACVAFEAHHYCNQADEDLASVWRDLRKQPSRTLVHRPFVSTNSLAVPNRANHRPLWRARLPSRPWRCNGVDDAVGPCGQAFADGDQRIVSIHPVVGRMRPALRNGLPMRTQGRYRPQTRLRSNTRHAGPPVRRSMSPNVVAADSRLRPTSYSAARRPPRQRLRSSCLVLNKR